MASPTPTLPKTSITLRPYPQSQYSTPMHDFLRDQAERRVNLITSTTTTLYYKHNSYAGYSHPPAYLPNIRPVSQTGDLLATVSIEQPSQTAQTPSEPLTRPAIKLPKLKHTITATRFTDSQNDPYEGLPKQRNYKIVSLFGGRFVTIINPDDNQRLKTSVDAAELCHRRSCKTLLTKPPFKLI